jgi:hypothetical protein
MSLVPTPQALLVLKDPEQEIELGQRYWGYIYQDKIPGGHHPFSDGDLVFISQVTGMGHENGAHIVRTISDSIYRIVTREELTKIQEAQA